MYNFIMLAQNNNTTNYVMQACVCAMSIKKSMPESSVAVITNDEVPRALTQFFDHIIPIPWGDNAENEDWKIHNRWKIIYASPYKEAVILDTDVLILSDISRHIEYMSRYYLFYTNAVYDYRGNTVTSDFYRKLYTKNDIPSLYTAFSYFRKNEFSFKFYEMLDLITKNWQDFYTCNGKLIQERASMDTTVGLATKILDCRSQVTGRNNKPMFVHMKPNIQGWNKLCENWTTKIGYYLNKDLDLYIGNYKQEGVFHYAENSFLSSDIIKQYCNYHGVQYEI